MNSPYDTNWRRGLPTFEERVTARLRELERRLAVLERKLTEQQDGDK